MTAAHSSEMNALIVLSKSESTRGSGDTSFLTAKLPRSVRMVTGIRLTHYMYHGLKTSLEGESAAADARFANVLLVALEGWRPTMVDGKVVPLLGVITVGDEEQENVLLSQEVIPTIEYFNKPPADLSVLTFSLLTDRGKSIVLKDRSKLMLCLELFFSVG